MTEQPTIERAYRVRLRLKPAQEAMLRRLFGAKRMVWNWAIRRKREAFAADGTKLGWVELSREFTVLRSTGETAWLSELPREPFNQVLRDFDAAWKRFFAGAARLPRRKPRGTVDSVRFTLDQRRDQVDRDAGSVDLPGLGKVRFRVTEPLVGRLRSVTIRRDSAGRWFAAFTADGVPKPVSRPATTDLIGIDAGLKSTAVLSTGEVIPAPKYLGAAQKRLKRYQRQYTRQRDMRLRELGLDPGKPIPKGTKIPVSNRMRRTKAQIGKLHARVADQRRDFQHQLTRRVVDMAEVIAIEDLAVKAMQRGMGRRAFRRSVSDAGLGEIRRQLTYKAAWLGRQLVVVDRLFPSSRTCGACGAVNATLKLNDRTWRCGCGVEHDRDINAARNIAAEGLRLLAQTPTAGRAGIARGGDACGVASSSVARQPAPLKRELAQSANRRGRRKPRMERGEAASG